MIESNLKHMWNFFQQYVRKIEHISIVNLGVTGCRECVILSAKNMLFLTARDSWKGCDYEKMYNKTAYYLVMR